MKPEDRRIWVVIHDGAPVEWRTVCARTPAEVDHTHRPKNVPAAQWERAFAALTAEQAADPTWDALPTSWYRVPQLARVGVIEQDPKARVVGRAVEVHGVRYHLDDRGRPHPQSTPEDPVGPLEPDPEIVDGAKLAAEAERQGRVLELVERGTGNVVRVEAEAARD